MKRGLTSAGRTDEGLSLRKGLTVITIRRGVGTEDQGTEEGTYEA